MPREAALIVNNIHRDLDLRAVVGDVHIDNVGGDAQLRNMGKALVNNIARDLNVRNGQGDFSSSNVGDDASLRHVHGSILLGSVGSDLYLRDVDGGVTATVGSDAVLYVQPKGDYAYQVTAGSDILMRVSSDVNATFSIQGGSSDSVRVDLPDVETVDNGASRSFSVGEGKATVSLTAGGDVIVTNRADEWESKAEFDPGVRDNVFAPGEFPGIPSDLHERISKRVEEATRRALRHTKNAEWQSERVQRKVEVALRRAEEKIRAAERRSMHMGVSFGRHGQGAEHHAPPPPPPPSDPVSDEERLTILRLLQEKKISLPEAEKLLAALEGK